LVGEDSLARLVAPAVLISCYTPPMPFHFIISPATPFFFLTCLLFKKTFILLLFFLFFDFSSCCIAPETTFNTVSIVVHFVLKKNSIHNHS